VRIVVVDDKTLSVELEYPVAYFLDTVASTFLALATKHFANKDPDAWETRENFVCNGPLPRVKMEESLRIGFCKKHPLLG